MASRKTSRSGWVVTGLGFGVAAGVALGTLVLIPAMDINGASAPSASVAGDNSGATADDPQAVEIAQAQANAADGVVAEVAPDAVAATLTDEPVLIMRTFDASDEDVAAVRSLLDDAGAPNSGEITLTADFFDQDKTDGLKSIIANTLPAGAQLSETNPAPGIHAGESLGAALMFDPESSEPLATVEDRALVLQTLRDQGYIDYEDETIRPARGIVLVTGDADGTGDDAFAAPLLVDVATALDSRGSNVVLAGRIHTAADQGAIGRLRANPEWAEQVSTVDSVDRAWGRVAAVLAMREQIDGGSGAYGAAASAEAPSPAPPASAQE